MTPRGPIPLFAQAAEKNRPILAVLAEHRGAMVGYALRICRGNLADAEDAVGEALLRIAEGQRRCASPAVAPLGFGCGVVKSVCSHGFTCARARHETLTKDGTDRELDAAPSAVTSASPERLLAEKQHQREVLGSFAKNTIERQVVELALSEEEGDRRELAKRIGVSPKAISDARERILDRVGRIFGEERSPSSRRRPGRRRDPPPSSPA